MWHSSKQLTHEIMINYKNDLDLTEIKMIEVLTLSLPKS